MNLKHCLLVASILNAIVMCYGDTMEIYNTKLATSDLQWDKHSLSSQDEGWEEVSNLYHDSRNSIRSHQICRTDFDENDNWIRSPFIPSRGGKEIHLDVEFSISRCSSFSDNGISSKCKETFNIFYYEADTNEATSTFPPWHENPYVKVDTVAANSANGINTKTFSFGPLSRKGFYIAVQDQGACMSLIALKVYYYYCPETTQDLAVFPETISDVGVASLVTAKGLCTTNAELSSNDEEPLYRCSSNGQWQIQTGKCHCREGYQANKLKTGCFACSEGTYKLLAGSGECVPCPGNSGLPVSPTNFGSKVNKRSSPHNQCPCHTGYARSEDESISVACTKPPSEPLDLVVVDKNATNAFLRWSAPRDTGGRDDTFYRFDCESSHVEDSIAAWQACPSSVDFVAPSSGNKFLETFVLVSGLTPYRKYRLTVRAGNGASESLKSFGKAESETSVQLQTDEAAPSQVTETKITNQTTTAVTLVWQRPHQTNGEILGYEVEQLQNKALVHTSPRPADLTKPVHFQTQTNSIELIGLDKDTTYLVRIRARTAAGAGAWSQPVSVNTLSAPIPQKESNKDSSTIVLIVVCTVGLLLVVFLLALVYRYRSSGKIFCLKTVHEKKKTQTTDFVNQSAQEDSSLQERLIVDLPPPGQRIYVEYPDPWEAIRRMQKEIDRSNIRIEEIIGTGEFAEVCKGKLFSNNQWIDVAMKRLKPGATTKDQSNFLREAVTMAQFNHPNVVQLKGVVITNQSVMIVTEYMEHRSLDSYLKLHTGKLSLLQLLEMLKGVANGMKYLSSMNYVHRDLAARNILLNNELVCKVSDFGLSRTLKNDPHATYTTQGGKIAVRWTAPESILFRQFASTSDVWSFGILMWEVMSNGEKPYWDMTNEDVITNVQRGMRLPSPLNCPKTIHDTMVDCWQAETALRPTFLELFHRLDALIKQPDLLATSSPSSTPAEDSVCPSVIKVNVDSVEKFLEVHLLSCYSDHFREQGINSIETLANLTQDDLKELGVSKTLHIQKLLSGISSLRQYLKPSSPPSSPSSLSAATSVSEGESSLESEGSSVVTVISANSSSDR